MISFKNKTYSHINPNVEEALISLINFSYKGSIQFDILIAELTTSNVSVVITNPSNKLQNLLVLGYQVILGVKEAISQFSTINTTAVYTSPHYNFKDSSLLITPFIGISYDLTDNVRLNKTYYTNQQAIWYQIHTLLSIDTKIFTKNFLFSKFIFVQNYLMKSTLQLNLTLLF